MTSPIRSSFGSSITQKINLPPKIKILSLYYSYGKLKSTQSIKARILTKNSLEKFHNPIAQLRDLNDQIYSLFTLKVKNQ
jgi:hypothetical protein